MKKITKTIHVDAVDMILDVLNKHSMEPYNDLVEVVVDNFNVDEFLEALGQYMQTKSDKLRARKRAVRLKKLAAAS